MKCNTGDLYGKFVEKLQICLQSDKKISGNLYEDLSILFVFGEHKFAIKVFLWTIKYSYIVDSDI